MTYERTSFAVAGGTGLQLPSGRVKIRQRDWTSTAPPFLRRTAEDLAALDNYQPATDKVPARVKKAAARVKANPDAPRAVKVIVDAQKLAADYTGGMALREVALAHNIGEIRARRILTETGTPIRARGTNLSGRNVKAVLDEAVICEEYKAGSSLGKMAQKYKTDKTRLSNILKDHGVQLRPRGGDKRWGTAA